MQPPTSVQPHTVNTEMLRGPLEIIPSPLHSHLQHQSKSFPPRLQRTPSISSQSSLDSAPSRHSVSINILLFIHTFHLFFCCCLNDVNYCNKCTCDDELKL